MFMSMVGTEKRQWRYDNSKNAQQSMRDDEKAAAVEVAETTDDIDGAREAEDVAPVNYTGGGQGGDGPKGGKKGKGKGIFKRKGAIGAILAIVLGGGGLMMGSQSLMPFSLMEQLRDTFDSIKTSNQIRNGTLWRTQFVKKELHDPVHKKFFGFGSAEFRVTSKQRNKLKNQGIYVQDVEVEGKSKSIMLFDDGSGKLKVVAPTEADINVLKGMDVNSIDLKGLDSNVDLSNMRIDTDDIVSFDSAFDNIADFRNGYIKGSRTWRGSIKAWFDSVAYKFIKSNKLTRNRFKKFRERVEAEKAGNTRSATAEIERKVTIETMDGGAEEMEVTVRHKKGETEYETDDDGSIKTETDANGNEVPVEKKVDTGNPNSSANGAATIDGDLETEEIKYKIKTEDNKTAIKNKMNEIKNGKLGKATGYVSAAANVACTVFDVIGAINLLIAAQEISQVVQTAIGFFEAVDGAKSGNGSGVPINVMAEALITPKATTVMQNATNNEEELKNNENVDIEEVIADGKNGTTAMQSSGVASMFGGGRVDPNDASVQNFNIGARFSTILGLFSNSFGSFAGCAIAKAAAAAADAIVDVIAIVTCAASFGIGCLVNALGEAGTAAGVSIGIGIAATYAINIITPLAVKTFTRNLATELAGEDFGNALVSGANILMGQNHLQGGGSLATKSAYIAFATKQNEVIAEEARFERETKDPFDVTSQYTFAGSLLKQIATLNTMPSSVFGALGTAARMVSSSITTMLPSASAYKISETLIAEGSDEEKQFETNCPYLASVGAVGDAFCNPYMITDMSTITMDPLEVVNNVRDSLDDDGNIIENTNLANYVKYCTQRSSAFGVADGNIANNFSHLDVDTGVSEANTVINGAIGAVPVIGDLIDVVNNSTRLANTGWITGQSCVTTDAKMESDEGVVLGVSWDENKYYQRFVEDQRLLEGLDDNYTSAVTSYLDKYYEEHPLDNSYEGILARNSGLTKDQVIALLDTIEYWDYIANYNPSTRYQMGEEQIVARHIDFGGEVIGESKTVILTETPIWDRRQRAIVVA